MNKNLRIQNSFVSIFICSIIQLFNYSAQANDSLRYVHKGLFRAEATFTPGIFFKKGLTATYLSGNLEYYFHSNASVRGDGYLFLDYIDKEKPLVFYHSIFAGASWHFPTNSHFDPYLGFQPGVGISESNELMNTFSNNIEILTNTTSGASVNPLISGVFGANYYFQKVFHIFGEIRLTQGKHVSDYPARSVSDLRFSFGLGLNIR